VLPGSKKGHLAEMFEALDPKCKVVKLCIGNYEDLIGMSCYVTVVHVESKKGDGRVFANVKGYSECDDEDKKDIPYNKIVFDLDSPDKEVFDKFWPSTKAWIQKSVGYQGSAAQNILEAEAESNKDEKDFDEDIQDEF